MSDPRQQLGSTLLLCGYLLLGLGGAVVLGAGAALNSGLGDFDTPDWEVWLAGLVPLVLGGLTAGVGASLAAVGRYLGPGVK